MFLHRLFLYRFCQFYPYKFDIISKMSQKITIKATIIDYFLNL